MYHNDIKFTSGAVILAALLLSVTDSKAETVPQPYGGDQYTYSQPDTHKPLLTLQPG